MLAAVKATVPLPLPPALPVIVIQLAPVDAVHAHPAGALTENEPEPPDDPTDWLVGDAL